MEPDEIYELVYDAASQALADSIGGGDASLASRMVMGSVIFKDNENRVVKEVEAASFFKKVTSVREKLRVLEQKINNNGSLSPTEKAELQVYITRSYGSLTTFNFLFREEADKFSGQKS